MEIAFWVSGNCILGEWAISGQVLLHPQQAKNHKTTSEYYETSRVCVLYDIYLGKQPTLPEERGGEARLGITQMAVQVALKLKCSSHPAIFRISVAGGLSG